MNVHKNARLTPRGRERMVRQVASGQTPKAVSEAAGVCPRTVRKWVDRFAAKAWRVCATAPRGRIVCTGRPAGQLSTRSRRLRAPALYRQADRRASSACHRPPSAASCGARAEQISALEPAEPVRRYERERPGEMIHLDIKKLGRIDGIGHRITGDRRGQSNRRAAAKVLGWEFVHVAIDDASRIAFAKVMPNERKRSATAFLKAALAYYESLGIKVERVMTDNGSCYKSFAFRRLCKRLGLKHIRTKPYTPKTNGKAERFIQTCLREWAYAQAYHHSRQRTEQLPYWLHRYNWHRPHAGIDDKTPISRLGLPGNNLLRLHS